MTLPELVLEDLVLATQFLPPSEHVTPTSLDHHFSKRRRRYESPSFVEGENHLKGRPKDSLFHMASPSWLALFLGWEEIRTQLYSAFHPIHYRVFRPSLAAPSDAGVDSEFFTLPSQCCPTFASLTHHHNFWHTVEGQSHFNETLNHMLRYTTLYQACHVPAQLPDKRNVSIVLRIQQVLQFHAHHSC